MTGTWLWKIPPLYLRRGLLQYQRYPLPTLEKHSKAFYQKYFYHLTPLICVEFPKKTWQNNAYKITGLYNWIGFRSVKREREMDWLSVSKKRERERTTVLLVSWSSLILYGSLKTLYWIEYSEFLNFCGLSTYQTSSAQVIQNLKFWESLTICENKLWFM